MKGIFVGQNISTSKHGAVFFQTFCSARLLIRQTTAMLRLSIIQEELATYTALDDEVDLVALKNLLLRMRYVKQGTE